MIDNNTIKNAGTFIKDNCNADDYTFLVWSRDTHQTRFAQNAITQHMAGENLIVNLEVAFGNKTGSASVNQLDNESLQYLIDSAETMAKLNQPDPEFISSESASELPEVNNFSETVETLTTDDLVANVKKCVLNAESKNAKVSGLTEKHLMNFYVSTKNGFEGFDRFSLYGHSMTMAGNSVETKVSKEVKDYSSFSLEKEIELLNSQFDSLKKPEPIEAQKIPVILRPAAVFEFFEFLKWMMDQRNADEGVTPFTGQMGKQFFGEKFSMSSTLEDPELSAARFNHSGVPSVTTPWIDKGVIKNMPVSRFWAKEKSLKPATPFNVFIEGGTSTEQDMMNAVDRGLIINHFWYIRFVDPKRGELTGLTRDGVLYFENGKVKNSVVNLRFNEIPHEVTRRILLLGESMMQDSSSKVPSMLVDDFNFVDTTTF